MTDTKATNRILAHPLGTESISKENSNDRPADSEASLTFNQFWDDDGPYSLNSSWPPELARHRGITLLTPTLSCTAL